MDSVRTVVNTVVNWLSPPDKPAGEETPPGAANSGGTTPRFGQMRDPSAGPSALKRAAPVEDGTLPEQFYTLNPEFLDDPDKWSYKDLQRLAKQLGVPGGGKGSRKQLVERLCEFNRCARRPRPLAPTELRTGYSLAVIVCRAGRTSRRSRRTRSGGRRGARTSTWSRLTSR